ncbi:MAG: hypothetical protein R3B09_02565 [Nannocystaceae bacterium]
MLKALLVALLGLHGLIHLLGFAKAFELAAVDALKLPISPAWGIAWLGVAVLLVVAAALRAADGAGWWVVAAVGAVASQALVLAFWSDAKAGSVANLLIVAAIAAALVGGARAPERAGAGSDRAALEDR